MIVIWYVASSGDPMYQVMEMLLLPIYTFTNRYNYVIITKRCLYEGDWEVRGHVVMFDNIKVQMWGCVYNGCDMYIRTLTHPPTSHCSAT